MMLCLPSSSSFVTRTTYIPISGRHSFSHLTHSHSSWIYCYYYTSIKKVPSSMTSAQNAQALPFADLGLRQHHHRTILPNLSYPFRPNSHVPWSWSSAPLLFSVNKTFFFVFCHELTPFALRIPRVLRWKPPLVLPVYKLVMVFF